MNEILEAIAPNLLKIITNPVGTVAEIGLRALKDTFSDDDKVESIKNGTATLSGEDITKIRLAEIAAKAEADNRGLKIFEAEVEARKSARAMQVAALEQEDVFSKRFIYYFAIFWSVSAVGYIFGTTFIDVPDDNIRVVDTVLGFILGTVVATILAFFYGTSASSMEKTKLLNQR
jgi:hypothetical protein